MKKTLIILLIIVICVIVAYFLYIYLTSKECHTKIECYVKIRCAADKKPFCQTFSPATGKKYPKPICACLNPNLEY